MSRSVIKLASTILILALLLSSTSFGRAAFDRNKMRGQNNYSTAEPAYCTVAHRIGKISLAVANNGTFGDGFAPGALIDCITGQSLPSCEFPKGANIRYLFAGAFWIGAVVGRDTLVSMGADGWTWGREFAPDRSPFGDVIYRSIKNPDQADIYRNAVSEEDYIMTYSDTMTEGVDPDEFGRPHVPLNIEVTQRSYAWSYPYAEDFVLFDYEIKNIGISKLKDTYMGLYVDADVHFEGTQGNNNAKAQDDICGFVEMLPTPGKTPCNFVDTVNIAWISDNDGDPLNTIFNDKSAPHVTGTRIVRTPADKLDVSFNWWISNADVNKDYGPRERSGVGRWKEDFRDFRTGGQGTPTGDANKYYVLRNQEFDFDQIYTAVIQPTDTFWSPPPGDFAWDLADGYDTRYLLSFGPFDIDPGERLPISFAYVAGENFHHQELIGNIDNLPDDPGRFLANLDFTDLGENAAWAAKVYDNPGIDTDGNGTIGEYRVCASDSVQAVDTVITGDPPETTYVDLPGQWEYTLADTTYYKGDGVPDFRGASPPPAPKFWLEPGLGFIKVRFNGLRSETTKDVFAPIADFEGYRVYIARDERASSYSMVASYDLEDYNRYVWDEWAIPEPTYVLDGFPLSLEALRGLYAASSDDETWHPSDYTRSMPYVYSQPGMPDKIMYFEKQDFNASLFGVNTPIRKIYPDEEYPSTLDADEALPDELTPDGFFKYFEYEFIIEDLLPTVPYWVNVTAFDFGSPESDLEALETSLTVGAQSAYPLGSMSDIESGNAEIFVYPNPYRIDASYRSEGFEGRTESDRPDDRLRAIHFANLPPKCTIKIFTLDGDLVREIDHDYPEGDPLSMHEEWEVITRNTQKPVSGLYYWTVETPDGKTQVGKLVIIM